jgi:lipopolysaccharide transport system ATP-binding protein
MLAGPCRIQEDEACLRRRPVNHAMNDDIAISVQGISKAYRIWSSPASRLLSPAWNGIGSIFPESSSFATKLHNKATSHYRDFWALKDVSLEVKKGECVGIIGRNGSGKSTLLQIIAGTLQPTSGSLQINGRVAALLELGSGFNPEFTGRENVYLNGAVQGLSRSEIDAKFAAITAFADIGDFIDQPVKTYSSGMQVRLAFAVQTSVEPDILIIDEALSVGDFFFAQKCMERIRALRAKRTAILFVSHDLSSVRDLCERASYLKAGHQIYMGPSQGAIARFLQEGDTLVSPTVRGSTRTVESQVGLDEIMTTALWVRRQEVDTSEKQNRVATLLAVELLDENRLTTTSITMGRWAFFQAYFKTFVETELHVALEIKNRHGHVISSQGTRLKKIPALRLKQGEIWECVFSLRMGIEAGEYSFQIGLGLPQPRPNVGCRVDETPWLGPITITWDYNTHQAPFLGMFDLTSEIRLAPFEKLDT